MKRYLFIVQGEGRGHLSQALALKQIVEGGGGKVLAVYTGCFRKGQLPGYFVNEIGPLLKSYSAPGFISNRKKTGIRLLTTFLVNSLRIPLYLKEIRRIRKEVRVLAPDVLINFYELNGALAMKKLPSSTRRISVAHHFYYQHPDARLAPGYPAQRLLLKWHNRILLRASDLVLALSFRPGPDKGKICIVPPLISKEVLGLERKVGKSDLAYFLYPGFAATLLDYAKAHNGYNADVFLADGWPSDSNEGIQFHALDREHFLAKLASCRYLLTTAGFETVAEAAYLGVPVLTLATGNHFEQHCNALDMERAGFGKRAAIPDPELLNSFEAAGTSAFREWAGQAEKLIWDLLA